MNEQLLVLVQQLVKNYEYDPESVTSSALKHDLRQIGAELYRSAERKKDTCAVAEMFGADFEPVECLCASVRK